MPATPSPPSPHSTYRPQVCDIFCAVIDNFGDIGVCWRLACGLADRGWSVRLWCDDASALSWMAPGGRDGVKVLPWTQALDLSAADMATFPCALLIEAFGCEPAPAFLAACVQNEKATGQRPVWLNLEYLSAEAYVERSHTLPSLVRSGPAAGWTRFFFYPGFTQRTGGLLREQNLALDQATFDRSAWLASQGLPTTGEKRITLFCYEPPALAALLQQLADDGWHGEPVRLLVTAGRASRAVQAVLEASSLNKKPTLNGRLAISFLPLLTQHDFDRLLWASDLNFVRGEDSLVRALWAGQPMVWQIYPQDDGAHQTKLDAWMEAMHWPDSLREWQIQWNAAATAGAFRLPDAATCRGWQAAALKARASLQAQDDLVGQLIGFAEKNR